MEGIYLLLSLSLSTFSNLTLLIESKKAGGAYAAD